MPIRSVMIAGAVSLALASPVFAESHEADLPAPVKARQAHMQLYGFYVGQLFGIAKGNVEYTPEAASAAASNLAALSKLNQSLYWPQGTSSDDLVGTRAKAAIWEDGSEVGAKAAALTTAAEEVAATAGDGVEAIQAGVQKLGAACAGCHKLYQEEE